MTMTADEMKRLRELCDAATTGPWEWRFPYGGQLELVVRKGLKIVMDAVRDGMNGATFRFAKRTNDDRGGILYKAIEFLDKPGKCVPDCQVPRHPDMLLMSEARTAIPALLDEIERLQVFVEAVRSVERATMCRSDGCAHDVGALLRDAVACLPENKGPRHD